MWWLIPPKTKYYGLNLKKGLCHHRQQLVAVVNSQNGWGCVSPCKIAPHQGSDKEPNQSSVWVCIVIDLPVYKHTHWRHLSWIDRQNGWWWIRQCQIAPHHTRNSTNFLYKSVLAIKLPGHKYTHKEHLIWMSRWNGWGHIRQCQIAPHQGPHKELNKSSFQSLHLSSNCQSTNFHIKTPCLESMGKMDEAVQDHVKLHHIRVHTRNPTNAPSKSVLAISLPAPKHLQDHVK